MDKKDSDHTFHNAEILRSKVDKIKTAMLTTFTANDGFYSRPMGTAEVDAEGNIWFYTNEFWDKAKEISEDNKVSIIYADKDNNTYLSIKGEAYLVDDWARMERLWNPFVNSFFPLGLDDPKITMLKVETSELEYWESSSSKIILLFNILKANILGEEYIEGEHRKLIL
jgi:general stress protein 26